MRILLYFLHNPWPPISGAHHRCLQVLRELKAAGHNVTFASSTWRTEQPWNEESKDAVRGITGQAIRVHEDNRWPDRLFDRIERKFRCTFNRNEFLETVFCPFSVIRWFRKLVTEIKPDAILINYAWFDQLMDHKRWKNIHRVIEIHDLLSINGQMWHHANRQIQEYRSTRDASHFREDFNAIRSQFHIKPEEEEVYRKYDTVLSISKIEQEKLQSILDGVEVFHAPFTLEPKSIVNTYKGQCTLSLGPNPFNIQGYLHFQDAILPKILKVSPRFRLTLTGSIGAELCQHPAIDWKGFVNDRDAIFRDAGYSISPVFAGTGQQIKIEEAMAYGLAVVAFEEAARNSSIKHGENGLVANSSEEFASHVLQLENDPELRIRLGQSAKSSIQGRWGDSQQGLRAFALNLGNGKRPSKIT